MGFGLVATFIALSVNLAVLAMPEQVPSSILRRQALDNVVAITNATSYCMIMPRTAHTDIGDSQYTGGMQTFCSARAITNSSVQGLLPDNFWINVELKAGKGKKGGRYAQLTGCIRPETVDRLNPSDSGGQYDSSGGAGGHGSPRGSVCQGYNHYVELVEPAGPRGCIKCCDDAADCPTNKDEDGCPSAIPGNYFDCD